MIRARVECIGSRAEIGARYGCIPKILVKGHNSKTPELAEGAGGLIGLAVSLAEGPTG